MADKLNRRIEVSVGRTVNLGDYESVKANVVLSQNVSDTVEVDVIYEELWETAEKQLDDYLAQYEGEETDKEEIVADQPLEDEVEKVGEFEGETEQEIEELPEETVEETVDEDEELDISEEDINTMTLKELKDLCKTTEGMEDIDLSLNLKPLRAVIIDLLFEEEDGTEDGGEGEVTENPDDAGGEPELDETGGDWEQDDWQS